MSVCVYFLKDVLDEITAFGDRADSKSCQNRVSQALVAAPTVMSAALVAQRFEGNQESALVDHFGVSSGEGFGGPGTSKAVSEQSKRVLGNILKQCCTQSHFLKDVLNEITTFGGRADSKKPAEGIQNCKHVIRRTFLSVRMDFDATRSPKGCMRKCTTPPPPSPPPPPSREKRSSRK